jgi:hypothetical protein
VSGDLLYSGGSIMIVLCFLIGDAYTREFV